MSRTRIVACMLTAALGGIPVGILANGGAASAPSPSAGSTAASTPEDLARVAFNSGIGHRDNGDKALAQKAKDEKESAKNVAKAKDEYTKALKDFQKAVQIKADFYPAYNGMGYASRKLGDYTTALQMYDKALSIAPAFADAIEYRGVAYLKLNRVDDAKKAYMDLFARDRKLADMLMKEMSTWVTEHRASAEGVDRALVDGLDTWLQERAKISATTSAMALTDHRSTWN